MVKKIRNYNYFSAFERMSNYSCQAAEMLKKILNHFDPNQLSEKVQAMHEIEHAADMETHKMQNHLAREFITPIEREDILRMAQQLDDVTDCIEDVVLGLYMYNIKSLPEEAVKMSEIIEQCCRALEFALQDFSNFKKSHNSVNERIIEINRLEEDCDKIYIEGCRRLYSTYQKEPFTLFTWSACLNRLEKCCDSCEDVSDVMERIIMKNS